MTTEEIDAEKLKSVKRGKTRWKYVDRFIFSEPMNELFS